LCCFDLKSARSIEEKPKYIALLEMPAYRLVGGFFVLELPGIFRRQLQRVYRAFTVFVGRSFVYFNH
jgi:hypothetical protein